MISYLTALPKLSSSSLRGRRFAFASPCDQNEGIRYREYNIDKERRRRHRSCSHSSDRLRNRPKSLSPSRALSKSKRSSGIDMAPLAAVILPSVVVPGQLPRVPSTVQEMVQNM
ncbi:hypothetical protein WN944_014344 [Citrus x changshan-huyou]|uniref:Uncharacterized protein n=1 Tax=Citrus x changshan-huyou TaxID=2935761 RepID=A0AAP0M5I1_9ROSI